jgi:hypothetical protein
LKLILALLGGGLGLVVTALAVYMAWMLFQHRKNKEASQGSLSDGIQAAADSVSAGLLLRWTFFDYAFIGVFAIGSLFLFTDAIAVIRDADSYPLYHYGYLLCGFVFTMFGMLFMVLRFALVLSLLRPHGAPSLPDHHYKPGQTNQAE